MYLLLKESNRFCRRLLHDDSGVFVTLTAIVFLSLFLMGMAILAVGDTVRKRIELQNAVDAAAYSAALIQADTLSRVAAINKAMAWTWVQSTRLEMDYCFDKFLEHVLRAQRETAEWAHDKNHEGNEFKGFPFWGMFGLCPYSDDPGERGGTVDNYEPEFAGQQGSQPPGGGELEANDDALSAAFADRTAEQLQSSQEAYQELERRKDALVLERDRLLAARDELQGRTPPHHPDPYNILSQGLKSNLLEAESSCSCLDPNSETEYVCSDCEKWRNDRNEYIKASEQLKKDYEEQNKKCTDAMESSQGETQNQVDEETESHGGLFGMIDQIEEMKDKAHEMESQLGGMTDTAEFYELQLQGIMGLISDLESLINEITETLDLYTGMQDLFLPPTIGINSHWILSLWGSLKRIFYRFEDLDTMETLFPSLAIAGQRTRIMRMNAAIDEMLFIGDEKMDDRASQTGFNVIRANTSFPLEHIACSNLPAFSYIKPYNDQSNRPTDEEDPEPRFLALAGYTATPRQVFGRGWHTGDNKHGWYRRKDSETLGRFYKQEDNTCANVAKWFFWCTRWLKIDLVVCTIIVPTYIGWGTESGEKERDGDTWFSNQKDVSGDGYLTGTKALKEAGNMAEWLMRDDMLVQRTWPRPHYLVKDKQWTSYNFAATAKIGHPFAVFGSNGWMKAFQIPNHIHAVSTATSGYRLPPETWAEEKTYTDAGGNLHHSNLGYRVWHTDEGSMEPGEVDVKKLWNLRVTDWDALLISAHDEANTGFPFDLMQPEHKAPAGMSGNTSHGGGEEDIGNLGDQSSGAIFDYGEGKKILIH